MNWLHRYWQCFRGRHPWVVLQTPTKRAYMCENCGKFTWKCPARLACLAIVELKADRGV